MTLINYPDVCTAPTLFGKAFCKEHCLVVEKAGYPSDLRAFLQTCCSRKGTGNILIIIVLLVPEEV